MGANSQQIESVLNITASYSLITGAAVLTDSSDWGSIGIVTPDTAKILLQIYDSTGDLFYQNTGWDAGDYTSPDLSLTSTTYSFTLPTDIAGAYLQGQYLVKTKVQVVEDGITTVVLKDFYQNIDATCNEIVIDVQGGVVAGTTEVNLTDYTNYKGYTGLSRTMKLYPPPPSAQPTQTGTNVDTIVYSGTVYTGVWTWTIVSDVTYTNTQGVSTTCRLTGQGTFNVQQSQLCKVLCLLEKYRSQTVLPALASKNSAVLLNTYLLAMTEYQFATNGYVCGKSQTVIDGHIQKIYDLTGIDPDCDCGCDDGTSQPLLSVTTVDGTDGTDGSQILYGSGVPSGGLGAVGDTYINTANGDIYKKTGASTWTFELTVSGTPGTNGASVWHNDVSNSATTGTTLQTLKTYSVVANTFNTNGDILHIHTRFKSSGTVAGQTYRVTAFGVVIASGSFIGNQTRVIVDIYVSRLSNTTGSFEGTILRTDSFGNGQGIFNQPPQSIAGKNFTTTAYDINSEGDSVVTGDVICEELQVIYLHKV